MYKFSNRQDEFWIKLQFSYREDAFTRNTNNNLISFANNLLQVSYIHREMLKRIDSKFRFLK